MKCLRMNLKPGHDYETQNARVNTIELKNTSLCNTKVHVIVIICTHTNKILATNIRLPRIFVCELHAHVHVHEHAL